MTTAGIPTPVVPKTTRTTKATWVYATAGALVGGILLGILDNLAQGWLPGAWNQIPNSGAVWSAVAFVTGALLARRASPAVVALAGLLVESGLVIGYYGYAEFGRDGMGSFFYPTVWLFFGFVAGPLFAIAATWWRRGQDVRHRVAGPAVLAGVFGGEGIHYAWTLHYAPQAWGCFVIAVLAALLPGRTLKERGQTLLAAIPLSLLAYVLVYVLVLNHVSA
ncbi:DUF6518 family protein [Streptomyces sp. NPDC051569]|uniref:DUF6518 family protein n=1 Tax=Streptomyces sp. NPDC051569 TaxID=3365661 RepID=UPI00378F2D0F